MAWDLDNPQYFINNDFDDVDHHCDHRDDVDDHRDDHDHYINNKIDEEDDDDKQKLALFF